MMALIHVDYDNARQQARRLQQAADDCGTVMRALQKELSDLSSYWTGAAAEACAIALENRIRDLKALQEDTEQLAADIRRVADAFEEKERQMKAAMDAAQAANGSGVGTTP